eukprot:8274304-Pyramimonas_sp.AAC.1
MCQMDCFPRKTGRFTPCTNGSRPAVHGTLPALAEFQMALNMTGGNLTMGLYDGFLNILASNPTVSSPPFNSRPQGVRMADPVYVTEASWE